MLERQFADQKRQRERVIVVQMTAQNSNLVIVAKIKSNVEELGDFTRSYT